MQYLGRKIVASCTGGSSVAHDYTRLLKKKKRLQNCCVFLGCILVKFETWFFSVFFGLGCDLIKGKAHVLINILALILGKISAHLVNCFDILRFYKVSIMIVKWEKKHAFLSSCSLSFVIHFWDREHYGLLLFFIGSS